MFPSRAPRPARSRRTGRRLSVSATATAGLVLAGLAAPIAVALPAAEAPRPALPASVPASVPAAAAVTTSTADRAPLLVRGMRGAAVRAWQRDLNVWLGSEGRRQLIVDGIFGPRTAAATLALQRAADIARDGIVGPQTRAALARLVEDADDDFDGTVGLAQADAVGAPVAVTDVRYGVHPTFERVVFDLEGSGHAGWHVEYVDSPVRRQGSAAVVPLAGDGQLEINLLGIATPGDGVPHYPGPERPNVDAGEVVQDLFVANQYEGTFQTFVGTSSPEPFRVFRLNNPKRIVVDIARPSG